MSTRRAFSLVEAVLAVGLVGGVVAVALNLSGGLIERRVVARDRALARALAADLIAEIGTRPYDDPNGSAAVPPSRSTFDNLGDYANLSETPPKTITGDAIPGFTGWTRSVAITYVSSSDPSVTSVSDTGAARVVVTVSRAGRTLATAEAHRTRVWDGVKR